MTPEDWIHIIHDVTDSDRNVIITSNFSSFSTDLIVSNTLKEEMLENSREGCFVDVVINLNDFQWKETDDVSNNYPDLLLQLSYIMVITGHKIWKNLKLRLIVIKEGPQEEECNKLHEFMKMARLEYTEIIEVQMDGFLRVQLNSEYPDPNSLYWKKLHELIYNVVNQKTLFVFMKLPKLPDIVKDTFAEEYDALSYVRALTELSAKMPPIAFVHRGEKMNIISDDI